MPFVILPTNSASGGYDITNSLRFNSGSSDNLSKTFGSSGNQNLWTWSSWVKRSKLGEKQTIFQGHDNANANERRSGIHFDSNDKLYFQVKLNGSYD